MSCFDYVSIRAYALGFIPTGPVSDDPINLSLIHKLIMVFSS